MGHRLIENLVYTVKDRCRVCYTCVRECPVKAIKIINGQAEVISERCIGCGNCVNVCSQGAKAYKTSVVQINNFLDQGLNAIACVAPSFPAEFYDLKNHRVLVGMLKKAGFSKVMEVSFGADLVSERLKEFLVKNPDQSYINSDCPAVVNYVEKFFPQLVDQLVPIQSPMVALARYIRKTENPDAKIIFIGPCIAKKSESDEIDDALTFEELRDLFETRNIIPTECNETEFDGPAGGHGSVYPITQGLLQTINKTENLVKNDIIVASGNNDFKEVIEELDKGEIESNLISLHCCNGCLMGPGMTGNKKRYFRRNQLSKYLNDKIECFKKDEWENNIKENRSINLDREFQADPVGITDPDEEKIKKALLKMNKTKEEDLLNCGACGYHTCREHAIAIINGLAETEMCLPYSIEVLHTSISDLNSSNKKLADMSQALKQSEKLAALGQLSAGIAHELNNPLGVITMYCNILKDEMEEDSPHLNDLQLLVEQSERCKNIVGSLLNFARKNQVRPSRTNMVSFMKRSLESVIIPENIEADIVSEMKDEILNFDNEQMMQAITNLEKNAVEAMPNGGKLSIVLAEKGMNVYINISDTGTGIAKENMDKLFTPFFTTKEPGKGTGLGLPLVYGIIKMHHGKIEIESNTDPDKEPTGTTFRITLPRQ
ncbi:MAG: 4Fe-4S dicluster domain-containing protein [Bacteroidales bacterium]|nr:4Fe-4S dicluster domain-containing protein [Bacteroidales bacterium]